ncbi:telomerase protein component 1-like [Tubulanus polymorphus]|uniref:telomerase protein component 1-like n=1 Tax=Tubulanus polymorphus TaxID=672921 RepID=UPI003DA235DC
MYKQYLSEVKQQIKIEAAEPEEVEEGTPIIDDTSDELFNDDEIDKCWQIIYERDRIALKCDKYEISTSKGGWKPIRLFVSSTFSDFFNEREILVKRVFPELQEWLYQRNLYLVECDLRWGIPKFTSTAETIATCMEEIDRCKQDNVQPFFLNMTGYRYGWVPTKEDISTNLREQYHWVDDVSITCMEILHGAFWLRNRNALFMFRDVLGKIPADHERYFFEKDPLARNHVECLKRKIIERFPEQVFNYACSVKGVEELSGRNRVVLTGLDDFSNIVLNFFKETINREYGDQSSALSSYQTQLSSHTQYMHQKAEIFYGRKTEQDILRKFLHGKCTIENESKPNDEVVFRKDMELWYMPVDTVNPIMYVMAAPGYGKSTLLADTVKFMVSEECNNLFYHFCGLSGDPCVLLARLITFLDVIKSNEDESCTKFDDYLRLSETDLAKIFKQSLLECSTKPICIVIDALNELLTNQSPDHLSWLPPAFPSNIYCIVSCVEDHLPTLSRLGDRLTKQLKIDHLGKDASRMFVENFFHNYSKKLDGEQLTLLMEKAEWVSPLWLQIACEELRTLGDYTLVTEIIENLDINMKGLLSQIITRLACDDHTQSLQKLLAVIACSEYGILETDVCQLLGDFKQNIPLPPSHWAHLRRVLSSFIKTYPFNPPAINFVHGTVKKAVFDICNLRDLKTVQNWHALFADFYQFHCKHEIANILPIHLLKAGYTKRLLSFIDDTRNKIKIPIFKQRMYKNKLRCQQAIVPNMTSPAIICNFCGCHIIGENNECCFCNVRYSQQSLVAAMLCMQHRSRHSNRNTCFKCGKITLEKMIKCEAKICIFCNTGLNKCCKLIVH